MVILRTNIQNMKRDREREKKEEEDYIDIKDIRSDLEEYKIILSQQLKSTNSHIDSISGIMTKIDRLIELDNHIDICSGTICKMDRLIEKNKQQEEKEYKPVEIGDIKENNSTIISNNINDKNKLSDSQKEALELVLQGKNVFITGDAGTGKSFLIEVIKNELNGKNINYQVCGMTGSCAYSISGITLHSFAGIGLGEGDVYNLI